MAVVIFFAFAAVFVVWACLIVSGDDYVSGRTKPQKVEPEVEEYDREDCE